MCSCSVYIYAGLIASGWTWHRWPVCMSWWACPLLSVTLAAASGDVSGGQTWGHGHTCGARGKATKVWSGCGCEEVLLLRPHRKWGKLLCGRRAFWSCVSCVVFAGLWASSSCQSTLRWKGGPWGTGWCCCGCGQAPPSRSSFQSFDNIKRTLLALAATPLWHR